jgi:hypothetical protein
MTKIHPRFGSAPHWRLAILTGVVAIVCCGGRDDGFCGAQEQAPPSPSVDRHPEFKRLSPTAEVWVDLPGKRAVVGGVVALDRGPIEFFACPQQTKEHESVIAVRSTAQLVHTSLLAIGLEPGKPVSFDPTYTQATGARVRVLLRWQNKAGAWQESDARDWIRDTRTGKALTTDWVFAGSSIWKDPQDGHAYYQADGGDLICVSNFPTATLDLPIESSQSNEALLFEAFAGRVPPRGTQVDLIFSAVP